MLHYNICHMRQRKTKKGEATPVQRGAVRKREKSKNQQSIVVKSDFDYEILILGSIFPNFPEYFS